MCKPEEFEHIARHPDKIDRSFATCIYLNATVID